MSSKILQYRGEDLDTVAEDILPPAFFDLDQRLNNVELNETLRWFIPGNLAVGFPLRFLWPFPAKNISMALGVLTAPLVAPILVDLIADDVAMFGNPNQATIAVGAKFGIFKNALLVTSLLVGAEMKISIDQVGVGTPGADLSMIIRSEKT